MADNDLLPRLAGAIFGAPLGPLGIAAGSVAFPAAAGLATESVRSALLPKVGTVFSYLNGKPYKVYAGPEFGSQSLESYSALRRKDPTKFPEITGVIQAPERPASSAPAVMPAASKSPSASASAPTPAPVIADDRSAGTVEQIGAENIGEQMAKQPSDTLLEQLYGLSARSLSPEFLKERTDQAIRQYAATTAITEALGAEKSEQRRRREVELAKIDQWTKAFQAQTSANALQNIAVSQAVIAMQQPNANTVAALQQGAQAAAQVLGVPTLRVT
jgi:hypothetical protein